MSQQSIDIVDDYVINPITKRKIKVGGRVFNQLLNDNILQLTPDDKTKVIYSGDNKENALKVKEGLNTKEFSKKHILKVKGNKIKQERRRVTREELNNKMARTGGLD